MFRLLRVDMADGRCVCEDIPARYAGMGGRGLTTSILACEAPLGSGLFGSLDPGGKMVFSPGLLGATAALSLNRLAMGCESATGGLQSAAVSCLAATHLLQLGILGIIIENAAPTKTLLQLEIRLDQIRLAPSAVAGMGIVAAMAKLRELHGPLCSCIAIGLAGENQLPTANMAFTTSDEYTLRHAGQGGMGAVMGAKGLKNILVFPPGRAMPPVADAEAYAKAAVRLGVVLNGLSGKGQSDSDRDSNNAFREGMEQPHAAEGTYQTDKYCLNICRRCGRSLAGRRNKHKEKSAAYKALWPLATTDSDNELRARFDSLCDDMGLDVFAVSAAVTACIRSGMLQAGDRAAVVTAVEQIGADTPLRRMLGGYPEGVPAVLPKKNAVRPGESEQQRLARDKKHHVTAFADAMGLCAFAARPVLDSPETQAALVRLLNARYGWALPTTYACSLGKRIVEMERKYDCSRQSHFKTQVKQK